jgi:myosin heavy subunit
MSEFSLELCSQQICLQNPKHQSVVISGESGAGKTESAKLVLNHIVKRGTFFSREESASSTGLSSLEDRLVKTSPLLEAFGNAKSKWTSVTQLTYLSLQKFQ